MRRGCFCVRCPSNHAIPMHPSAMLNKKGEQEQMSKAHPFRHSDDNIAGSPRVFQTDATCDPRRLSHQDIDSPPPYLAQAHLSSTPLSMLSHQPSTQSLISLLTRLSSPSPTAAGVIALLGVGTGLLLSCFGLGCSISVGGKTSAPDMERRGPLPVAVAVAGGI